jgi:hypothetical protein
VSPDYRFAEFQVFAVAYDNELQFYALLAGRQAAVIKLSRSFGR